MSWKKRRRSGKGRSWPLLEFEYAEKYLNHFTYGGINSLSMGLVVDYKENVYGAPRPVVETAYIPGRGTVIYETNADPLDNAECEDFSLRFTCHVLPDEEHDLPTLARKIYAWLYAKTAFKRLEDSYDPDYFREAYVKDAASVEDIAAALLGKVKITFTARAYKYALGGELKKTFTAPGGTLYNAEAFTARPLVTVYGSGDVTLYFNDRAISIKEIEDSLTIDSFDMIAYKEDTLFNSKLNSQYFPRLVPGKNTISWAGNVQRVEIVPRWCSL